MNIDFSHVWHVDGWDDFFPVEEDGLLPLTIQFLCTLREVDDGVCLPLKNTSCDFNRHEFWGLISGQVVHGKFAPQCNEIQNPTLHLMHKWVAITLFPRDDPGIVCNDELMILYAMVNKI